MVGNDIVDLGDRDTDPAVLNPGFDSRVFTAPELESLDAAPSRVRRRWRLWAAKEAAYKAAMKIQPGIIFSPSRFRVELAFGATAGIVRCDAGVLRLNISEWTSEDGSTAVHAVATSSPRRSPAGAPPTAEATRVVVGLRRLDPLPSDPRAPSRAVRSCACERLADELRLDPEALEIRQSGPGSRIPELWVAGTRADADLSLSHHGGFVAFACEVARNETRARPESYR